MNSLHPNAETAAREYIGIAGPLKELGCGVDGVVYASPHQTTAVKVHTYREKFINELSVYRRLERYAVSEYQGFSVPKLRAYSEPLQILEMSIVRPPFLLDFAGAKLDRPRDFSPEVQADWWERTAENFGDDFKVASAVYWGLVTQFKIFYYDLKPGNLQFR